jgi:hypothetical protein
MTGAGTGLSLALALGLTAVPAVSAKPQARALSLFTIGKSQNKNQVQYAVRVDGQCAPASNGPVFAYWRMRELGPTRVEPLQPGELRAYGPASQASTGRSTTGGRLSLVLRALPNRPIVVETQRAADGACKVFATIAIAGRPAHLFDVYVKLTWRLSVDYLLLRGWSMDGTRILTEKLRT